MLTLGKFLLTLSLKRLRLLRLPGLLGLSNVLRLCGLLRLSLLPPVLSVLLLRTLRSKARLLLIHRSLYRQSPHSSRFLHASRAPSSLRVSLRVSLRMRAIRLIRAVPRLRHLPDRLLPRAALPRFLPRSSVLRGSLRLP